MRQLEARPQLTSRVGARCDSWSPAANDVALVGFSMRCVQQLHVGRHYGVTIDDKGAETWWEWSDA